MNQPSLESFFKIALHVLILILFVSLYYSMLFMSMSIIGMSILSLLRLAVDKNSRNQQDKQLYFGYCLLFTLVVCSGINSSNTVEWVHQVQMKLAFLALPLVLYTFQDHFKKYSIHYLSIFIGVSSLSLLPVLHFCLDNPNETIQRISKGQAVPTPIDHLKYSLSLCLATLISFQIYLKKAAYWKKIPRTVYLVIGLILAFSLHLLAVRSGLILLYLGLLLLIIHHLKTSRHKLRYIGIICCLMALPFIAYVSVPNFKKKVQYSIYDFNMYLNGEGKNYSDSERLYGYSAAYDLIKTQPIFGTGIGDLRHEITHKYEEKFNFTLNKYPHNQYLYYLTGTGLVGLLIFLFSILLPYFYLSLKDHFFYFLIQILFLTSFLVENVLERSYGAVLFLIMSMLTMQFCKLIIEKKEELQSTTSH